MGLILAPLDMKRQINSLRKYVSDTVECYNNAKEAVQQYVSDEQLIAESWEASKDKMNICYAAIVSGVLAACDSINSDLTTLENSIGDEYLDSDMIEEQKQAYQAQCKTYEGMIEEAKAAQKNLSGLCDGSMILGTDVLINRYRVMIEKLNIQIGLLDAKLKFLEDVNNETANLFESAISMISTVTAAIDDGECVINGGEVSNIDWSAEIYWTITKQNIDNGSNAQYLERLRQNELNLSPDQLYTVYSVAEALLNEGFSIEFVAGMLGNINNENVFGGLEDSNYDKHPEDEGMYLKYMDLQGYRNALSDKNIMEVGYTSVYEYYDYAFKSPENDGFGFGCVQWTFPDRQKNLMKYYEEACEGNDIPTLEQCKEAECRHMIEELVANEQFRYIYPKWIEESKGMSLEDKTKKAANTLYAKYFMAGTNTSGKRSEDAVSFYKVMMGE